MKNNILKISTAFFLCCVLCFGTASPITTEKSFKTHNSVNTVSPLLTPVQNNETREFSLDTDEYALSSSDSAKEIITPEDILPDTDNVTQVPDEENSGQSSVTTVPAILNNVMRDSLASVISKKVYTFSVENRGAVVYGLNHLNSEEKVCLWNITLYEEYSPDGTGSTTDFRILNRISYEKIGTSVTSTSIGILPGNYKIEVECITGYTPDKYDIVIGYLETDAYETEPNDTAERYTHLPLNKTISGSARSLPDDTPDTDYYLFRVTDAGYTVVYFNHEADSAAGNANNIAWRISLADLDGNEYFYAASDMNKTTINSGVMGLPPGYYILKVASHIHSGTTYTVNASFTADEAIETESNDTRETANAIQVNTEKIGSLTNRDNKSDRDFYTFTMTTDGFIVIDFIHEALTDDNDGWRITITDEDGETAYETVSKWNQAILQSPNIGLTAGKYFIKIDSDNLHHSSIVYRLILLTVESTGWETEPNNTMQEADVITLENAVSGTMIELGVDYDKDYYVLDVAENTAINISFSHIATDEKGKEGWVVSLLDSNGNKLESSSVSWDSGGVSFSKDIVAGRYYVLVETGLYFNSARYVLTVSK